MNDILLETETGIQVDIECQRDGQTLVVFKPLPFGNFVTKGSPLQFTGLDIETNSLDIVNAPRLHWM